MYYNLEKDAHLPAVPRDAITKRLLPSRAELLFGFVDRSTALTIATLAYEYIRGETDRPEAFYRDPDVDSLSSYVVVRERRLPVATHVDSRFFRGFSSQHFRLELFVRFKGNLAQPKAIRSKVVSNFIPLYIYEAPSSSPTQFKIRFLQENWGCRSKATRPSSIAGKSWSGLFLPWKRATPCRDRQLYWVNQNVTSGTSLLPAIFGELEEYINDLIFITSRRRLKLWIEKCNFYEIGLRCYKLGNYLMVFLLEHWLRLINTIGRYSDFAKLFI